MPVSTTNNNKRNILDCFIDSIDTPGMYRNKKTVIQKAVTTYIKILSSSLNAKIVSIGIYDSSINSQTSMLESFTNDFGIMAKTMKSNKYDSTSLKLLRCNSNPA